MKEWHTLSNKEIIRELEHELNQCHIAPDEFQGSIILNADQVQQVINRLTELTDYYLTVENAEL